jgi:FecR-like protein
LAMGPNSVVIIDEYVLGSGNRVKRLTLNVTKGTLRWISGKSPSSAYTISTAAGTLGVRGTAVDIAVRGNSTMMVLLNGAARWCLPGRTDCVEVTRPCDFIIANGGSVSEPQRVTGSATDQLGAGSLPFLIDNQRLLPSFRLGRANCGIGINRFPSRNGSSDRPDTRPGPPNRGGGEEGGGEGGGLQTN